MGNTSVRPHVLCVGMLDCSYHEKSISNNRFRPSPADFKRYQRGREKEEEENLEISSCDPSPAGDFFSLREEKKRLPRGDKERGNIALGRTARY
ncbi:hypothetical protein B296_00043819 [Ensete ventricosum]|uniref:Uncharacterized protein n=1 Tax=Ensete ventricosum TaxID=4639 RepID=A0A426YXT7_ENSVE|nr:hypothetical protein B296_00043819 [Ensete ventricosum]